MKCELCGKTTKQRLTKVGRVYECGHCLALYGNCYLGESYELVRPYMTDSDPNMERSRYYDFMCLGSQGITRRHGWFDPESRMITQVG